MTHDPSHPGRDPELGDALRAVLDCAGNDAFVASVLAQYHAPRLFVRDALASWSRWGVAAAAAVAVIALLAVPRAGDAEVSLDDALIGAGQDPLAMMMADDESPGSAILYAPAGEGR